jgi:hypothetical protein
MVVSCFFFNLHLQLKKAETIVWPTSADRATLGLGVSVNGLDPIVRFKQRQPQAWQAFDRQLRHLISSGLTDADQQASDPPKLADDNPDAILEWLGVQRHGAAAFCLSRPGLLLYGRFATELY